MADHFVDPAGNDGNSGHTLDLPWATLEYAFENGSLNPGDIIWVRRTTNETPSSDIAPVDDGTILDSIKFVGAPRAAVTGTGDFTQGESVITNMSFATVFSQHVGRMIKNDTNGDSYFITEICMKIDYDNEQGGESFSKGDIVVSDNGDAGEGKIQMVDDNGATGTIWIVVRSGTFADDDQLSVGVTYIADIQGTPDADDGLLIDFNYAGTTDTTANLTIETDPYRAEFLAYDDSADTMKLTTWDADAKTLAKIDFDGGAYNLNITGDQFHEVCNLEITGSTDTNGNMVFATGGVMQLMHFVVNQNTLGFLIDHQQGKETKLSQVIVKGNNTGAAQTGAEFEIGTVFVDKMAISNCGDYGLYLNEAGVIDLQNFDSGVSLGNGDYNLFVLNSHVTGRNVTLSTDDTGAIFCQTGNTRQNDVVFTNYQKTLNNVYRRRYGYIISSNDGTGAGVNLRSGGAAYVMQYAPGGSGDQPSYDRAYVIFNQMYFLQAASTTKAYRYYIQNDGALNTVENADIRLEATCISSYNSATVYKDEVVLSTSSANPMPAKADADDWGQYLTVSVTTPAVDCIVKIRCLCNYYDASNQIYIGPKVSIT